MDTDDIAGWQPDPARPLTHERWQTAAGMWTTSVRALASASIAPVPAPAPDLPITQVGAVRERRSRLRVLFGRHLGAVFMAVGLVGSVYVGWQLWGTSVVAEVEQAQLAARPEPLVVAAYLNPAMTDVPAGPTGLAPADVVVGRDTPEVGQPLGTITVDRIGLDATVVVGVEPDQLAVGPGWMPGTSLPGDIGNATLSGHRTTYGGLFRRLDELVVGDRVTIDVPGRDPLVYEVRGTEIVTPQDTWVVAPTPGARLTLTTCGYEDGRPGGDSHRIVVQAELVDGPNAEFAVPADQWTFSAPTA